MSPEPYYSDEAVQLYLGDCREILPALGVTADCIMADPPYGETALAWDRWPDGWIDAAAKVARSMWCFGSLRMFMEHAAEFRATRWKFSQDVIWEKQDGSGLRADRFKRVHEQPAHWYQGEWSSIRHEAPRAEVAWRTAGNSGGGTIGHWQTEKQPNGGWQDDGTRLVRSVLRIPNMWRRGAIHPTEKPIALLDLLISYACPPGGLVVAPFAGSGSDLDAARSAGRRAIGVELYEPYAERAALRLSQAVLIPEPAAPPATAAHEVLSLLDLNTDEPAA